MTTEERMEIIKNKAKQIANAKQNKEKQAELEYQTLVDKVRAYFESIQDLLSLANACANNGIKMPKDGKRYGYEWSFIAEGEYHHVGLIKTSDDFQFVGIRNGGCCGEYDFWTDGNNCYAVHESNHGIKRRARTIDLTNFVAEYPQFEKAFLAWIDNMEV